MNFLVDPLPLIWGFPVSVVAKQARKGSITFRRYDGNFHEPLLQRLLTDMDRISTICGADFH